ncbi:hypothetical protein A2767_03650 [Candidatus Roizmanbacteria bacterium RIFCSPHIGHO2_01_FULL_35_10]|uniref:HTH cro/C1-type domain-containing protein n=1 Tax=Candidatus Roizmanbacteria bacterium RIFCSPLOWO2_01_FULL_35_13 TaxID=1802055 RepID=A0A1F7IA51_9BACT|nr:MAG: hypothetical protein A2767_03650 [Candidatus Roizmanbacteria bacterium RIFCSPHIGHO2_01_FULL_35_10]OGK40220.1 MAG: hypothetical protein A3A74_06965 [Candidatus Roizmanbacteria bacterium RIFCSPLOWO2_01_FULL_35_13]
MKLSKEVFLKKFGQRVKFLRRQTGLSQEQFADKVGIHRTYMGRIEQGKSNTPIFTIYRIVKACGLKSSEFLSL